MNIGRNELKILQILKNKKMFEEIINAINQSPYVSFSKPILESEIDYWILKAEERLGLKLPFSYKWWLKNYGGGHIGYEEIYCLYGRDFDDAAGGDIVYNYIVNNEEHQFYDPSWLVVSTFGDDELYYFDTALKDDQGEYPVYIYDIVSESSELYANNFAEFLLRRIKEVNPI